MSSLSSADLVDGLLAREPNGPRVFWYYTPMALAFTSHLECDLCVYDYMDELSLFRGASPELIELEDELFARADLVFTGGMSLYEAKRNRHRNVHGFPSSHRLRRISPRPRAGDPDPADQAAIPHPRLGFFGVIDERMDIDLVGRRRRPAARLAVRHDRPGGEDRSGDPAAARQHPLARRQELRGAAALPRRLGRRLDAVRAQRVDALHQPDQDARIPRRRRAGGLDADHATSCAPTARRGWSRSPRRRSRSLRKAEALAASVRRQRLARRRSTGISPPAPGTRPGRAMHRLMLEAPRRAPPRASGRVACAVLCHRRRRSRPRCTIS